MSLPATNQGVSQPATLDSLEPKRDAPEEMQLRLRLRKADGLAQQRMTRWIGELALQTWHAQ